jgi:hypothetical protein
MTADAGLAHPLRVVLLTASDDIELWLAQAIDRAVGHGAIELAAIATPAGPIRTPNAAASLWEVVRKPRHWGHFVLRRTLLRTSLAARLPLDARYPEVSRVEVSVEQVGSTTYVSEPGIAALVDARADVILLGELGILKGAVLDAVPFGVWSFHHGDPRAYRGRPSCFWELHDGADVVSAGLQRLNETLDGGAFLGLVTVGTRPSFGGTMDALYDASTTLLASVAHQVVHSGELPDAIELPNPLPPVKRRPGNRAVLTAARRVAGRALGRLWRGVFLRRDWRVGVAPAMTSSEPWSALTDPSTIQWLTAPRRKVFWADPFVVEGAGGSCTLLVEEFDHREGYGRIVMLGVRDGAVTERRVVLDDGHHHAFPQLVRVDDGWLATTDTCCDPPPIYRFSEIGERWEPIAGATLPAGLSDPVLSRDGERWVAVGTARSRDSASWCVAYEASALGAPWTEVHPGPRFVDVRRARGGGTLDVRRRVRAAQDLSRGYGERCAVWTIGPDLPSSAPGSGIGPQAHDEATELAAFTSAHTVAWDPTGAWTATDRCDLRLDPLAWLSPLREPHRRLRNHRVR